jgi:hypothetical protein
VLPCAYVIPQYWGRRLNEHIIAFSGYLLTKFRVRDAYVVGIASRRLASSQIHFVFSLYTTVTIQCALQSIICCSSGSNTVQLTSGPKMIFDHQTYIFFCPMHVTVRYVTKHIMCAKLRISLLCSLSTSIGRFCE